MINRSSSFAKEMIDSFPPGLPPPEPIVRFFHWLEANKLDTTASFGGGRYARIDPAQRRPSVSVGPVDPQFAIAWLGEDDPAATARMAAFVQTGGDGSQAGLWRDDDGSIKFVHHGSGSGSTMLCVLTDDPVDFLRLLAIGYDELCWPNQFHLPPVEAFVAGWGEEQDIPPGPILPVALQRWVMSEFGVTIPRTASEIVTSTADMDANESEDAFWRWVRQLQG